MEKRVEFVGSIIIFFVLLFIYSKFGPSLPISVLTQTKGEPMMVTEVGTATVVPDIAKVSLGIEAQGQNLKSVQEDVNKKSKALTGSLEKLGLEKKNIKTTNYSVSPEYDYQSTPYRINGYRVSSNYEVKITDFEIVNDVLVSATETGANVIGNISFEVNDETKAKITQEAREEAVKLAKEKAEGLAKAGGIKLGKIINISETTGFDYPRPIMYAKEMSLDSVNSPTVANVTPGETEINVTVSLSYEIR